MQVFPLFNHVGGTRPLGLEMSQNRLAVPTWSYAMEMYPPIRIIELGTAGGGFITALALHAYQLNAEVVSFDRSPPREDIRALAEPALRVRFITADIWASESMIAELIRKPGRCYVLCDGGDKPRELDMCAQYLKVGDVVAAHDYDAMHEVDPQSAQLERPWPWSEIRKSTGDGIAKVHGLEPFMQNYFDMAGWLAYQKALPVTEAR